MAKLATFTVQYSCGHTAELTRLADRMNVEIEQAAETLCSPCGLAQKAAERKARYEALELSLPALEGSEKQIAWAQQIRTATLDVPEEVVARRFSREDLQLALAAVRAQTKASWWIDQRGKNLSTLVSEMRWQQRKRG